MRFASLFGTWIVAVTLFASVAPAQTFDAASYVKQLHQRYIGRAPKAEESAYWIDQMNRGATADEVHAGVLGSEAYFNRHNRNPASWVDGAFAMVQNRTPSEVERTAWLQRLTQLGDDRIRWAKEFLTASGASLPPVTGSGPIAGGTGALADQLVTTTRLLSEAVTTELPGTRNWLVKVQATNLEATAAAKRDLFADPARDPVGAAAAQQDLVRSVDAFHSALTSSQANAANSRYYLTQTDQLVRSIGQALSGGSVAKPPVSPIVTGYDAATAERIDSGLLRLHAQSAETALLSRTVGVRDYEYVRLQNDLDAFHAQTDAARDRLRTSPNRAAVQADLASLRTQASTVTNSLQRSNVDARVTSAWYQTVQTLDGVCTAAGLSGPIVATPLPNVQPVDWSSPISTDWTKSQRIRDAVAAVQAECDALVAAYAPYAFYSFHIQSLQEELRSLRSAMDAVSQAAASGSSTQQLWERIADSNGDYAQAKSYLAKAQASSGVQNLPPLSRLSQALSRLNAAAAGG